MSGEKSTRVAAKFLSPFARSALDAHAFSYILMRNFRRPYRLQTPSPSVQYIWPDSYVCDVNKIIIVDSLSSKVTVRVYILFTIGREYAEKFALNFQERLLSRMPFIAFSLVRFSFTSAPII